LKGVSLQIEKGEVMTLIGSSGSGKSTLLRCLNLLERPNSRQLIFGGEHIRLARQKDGTLFCNDARQLQQLRGWRSFCLESIANTKSVEREYEKNPGTMQHVKRTPQLHGTGRAAFSAQ
jgi:ABC-type histidine transport system ATPase subunit